MKLMIDQHDIWNAIYNARNNRWHPPTSPNTAPATQNDCHDWSSSHIKRYETLFTMRGINNRWHPPTSPNTAPATQNDSPTFQRNLSKLTKYCACHEKWISWLILVTHETLFTMRGVTSVIVQTHQILRLPRKMNLMIDPCHTWNAIYNARN